MARKKDVVIEYIKFLDKLAKSEILTVEVRNNLTAIKEKLKELYEFRLRH